MGRAARPGRPPAGAGRPLAPSRSAIPPALVPAAAAFGDLAAHFGGAARDPELGRATRSRPRPSRRRGRSRSRRRARAGARSASPSRRRRGRIRSPGRSRSSASAARTEIVPEAGPEYGSLTVAATSPSPAATKAIVGGELSTSISASGAQPWSPAKSVAQPRTVWAPSASRVVSTSTDCDAVGGHGCSLVARASPSIVAHGAGGRDAEDARPVDRRRLAGEPRADVRGARVRAPPSPGASPAPPARRRAAPAAAAGRRG